MDDKCPICRGKMNGNKHRKFCCAKCRNINAKIRRLTGKNAA